MGPELTLATGLVNELVWLKLSEPMGMNEGEGEPESSDDALPPPLALGKTLALDNMLGLDSAEVSEEAPLAAEPLERPLEPAEPDEPEPEEPEPDEPDPEEALLEELGRT
jgi:hypothetical protein